MGRLLITMFFATVGLTFTIQPKSNKAADRSILLSATWVCQQPFYQKETPQSMACCDTFSFYINGVYEWHRGNLSESGQWKLNNNDKELLLYNRRNPFLENFYHQYEPASLHLPVIGLNESALGLKFNEDDEARERIYNKH